jgi:hypothetical protein
VECRHKSLIPEFSDSVELVWEGHPLGNVDIVDNSFPPLHFQLFQHVLAVSVARPLGVFKNFVIGVDIIVHSGVNNFPLDEGILAINFQIVEK